MSVSNRNYFHFSKSVFERELYKIIVNHKYLLSYQDVTDSLSQKGYPILEYVYVVKTRNPYVSILIYSSIDKSNSNAREIGKDAVRVVLVWKTKKGHFYKKLHKHLRIQTVFKNLEKTLIEGNNLAVGMKLKIWEFQEGIGLDY